ncbi:MAG: GspE/PulE family protein [Candidatus Nanopelagicales bacterium]|nr:GspE/PulE family protein [Candidatus Nanopelagicales bacterium]MCF8537093.1 GspE/PulE family protein [Candidatus Nanopelagicales bacterium]MCF8542738.1 GspE/PulE family protein [Candidatus Nanopelagicales bacterium]MCF8556681.1 GspE/PulE family protein [Candidatus Nanopelagicales bacterium]
MSASVADVLVSEGLISSDQLAAAEASASSIGEPVLNVLVKQGAVSKKDVVRCTVEAAGLDFVEIMDEPVDPEATALLTGDQARKYGVIPLRFDKDVLVVASDSQTAMNWQTRDDLQAITRRPVRFACAMKAEVQSRLNMLYRAEAELGELVRDMMEDEQAVDILAPVASTSDAPLVRYVNLLLNQAISDNASDIHVEPTESNIRIRFRIDGVLKEMAPAPKEIQSAVISRLKIMSDMDIAERRIPQDGRLTVMSRERKIDLRVSCLPTVWGEKIVMRILDNTAAQMALPDLGFSPENLTKWRGAYERPYGMLIVSGPTGSGKSTSLYATLHAVARPEVNIVTVEDPVEYRIPGINQIQVNAKAGLTFASALRSILRADPDIILIGEIRDHETAQIAIESALTGHLVLTTLHTNDAPSVITRLTEMEIEPFLVASALECATGQRLARRLCTKCKRAVEIPAADLAAVQFETPAGITPTFFEPVGCSSCADTGYRGRLAMHEVMPMTESLGKLAVRNASSEEVRRTAISQGMRTLRQDGWLKVAQGQTTIGEVLRVIA